MIRFICSQCSCFFHVLNVFFFLSFVLGGWKQTEYHNTSIFACIKSYRIKSIKLLLAGTFNTRVHGVLRNDGHGGNHDVHDALHEPLECIPFHDNELVCELELEYVVQFPLDVGEFLVLSLHFKNLQ